MQKSNNAVINIEQVITTDDYMSEEHLNRRKSLVPQENDEPDFYSLYEAREILGEWVHLFTSWIHSQPNKHRQSLYCKCFRNIGDLELRKFVPFLHVLTTQVPVLQVDEGCIMTNYRAKEY